MEMSAAYRMTLQSARPSRQTGTVMTKKHFASILSVTLVAGGLYANSPKTQALLMALGANAKQMTPYQWKQKVTVIRKGIPAGAILEEIRFDASGQPQRTVLSKPEEKPMGPLRARKVAEVKESVQEVMQLAGRYANPQMLSQAIQKGEIWEGQGSLRVQSRGLILPMDEMTMLVNGATFLASRIDVKTQHEGSPVAIAIDYQQLPNGPSMVARMTVQIPGEDVVVNVESFDFVRLSPIVH
jgi:hypothetical protein